MIDFHKAELLAAGALFTLGFNRLKTNSMDGLGISLTLAGMTAFFDATQALWPRTWKD